MLALSAMTVVFMLCRKIKTRNGGIRDGCLNPKAIAMDKDYKSATETSSHRNMRSGTLVNPTSEKPKIGRGIVQGELEAKNKHIMCR